MEKGKEKQKGKGKGKKKGKEKGRWKEDNLRIRKVGRTHARTDTQHWTENK